MGCSDPAANDPIFTSFKLGAYSKGLELTDEFQKEIEQYDTGQKQTILRDSSLIDSRGQIAITNRGDIRNRFPSNDSPFLDYFPSINDPTTREELAERNVAYTIGINNSIEVTLPIPGDWLKNTLAYLSANHHITLTYNNGLNSHPLGPGRNQYYGRAYEVDFDKNLRYVEDIKEYNLLTGKRVSGWSCSGKSRLMVLRHEQISEQFWTHRPSDLKEWYDYYEIPREAVCVEDRGALSRVGKQSLEDLLPDNLFVVGFVHTWEKDGSRLVLKKTDAPCLTTQTAHWSCYDQNTQRVEWNERNCQVNHSHFKCPAYLSFCTKK